MASQLYEAFENIPEYFKERKVDLNKLKTSTTLYIGNLSFFTTETQMYELFSTCGEVNRIIMGLNKNTKTPCGFCFVEYFTREDAARAIQLINNTYLDNRIIRLDWDLGFVEGRQYGRGFTGAQKRDEIDEGNEDPDRPRDIKYQNKKRGRDNRDYRDNRNYSRDNRDRNQNKKHF